MGKAVVIKPCRLCHRVERLQHSHIVPEWLYLPFYDTKHEIHVLSTNEHARHKKIRKGLREYLLCWDCEQHFAKYEDYAAKQFNEKAVNGWKIGNGIVSLSGLNYVKLKLCMMSFLWRMSVASHIFCKEVQLGCHEEPLRKALLAGTPLKRFEYGFTMSMVFIGERFQNDVMLGPSQYESPSGRTLIINPLLSGFHIHYFTSEIDLGNEAKEFAFRLNGELRIKKVNVEEDGYLTSNLLKVNRNIVSTLREAK